MKFLRSIGTIAMWSQVFNLIFPLIPWLLWSSVALHSLRNVLSLLCVVELQFLAKIHWTNLSTNAWRKCCKYMSICKVVIWEKVINHILYFKSFSDEQWVVMYDYEMRPGTRRPKVLVQTAGHVSGAVYFYQKSDIANPPWPSEQVSFLCIYFLIVTVQITNVMFSKGIYGVCLHPEFVGWFAIRAVVVFPNILAPDLVQVLPKDILAVRHKTHYVIYRDYESSITIIWAGWGQESRVAKSIQFQLARLEFSRHPRTSWTLFRPSAAILHG